MTNRSAKPWLAGLTTLAVYLAGEVWIAARPGPALDDGWIYLAFARGFVEGDWFSYPGAEGPAGAITAPLWSFLLALGMALGGASPMTAKVLGGFVFGFTVWACGRLARAATGDEHLVLPTRVIVAVTARVAWASLSGMEAGLGVGLVALGLALHLERRRDTAGRWAVAAVVLGLAGWSRPESFVFLVLAALHRRSLWSLGLALALCGSFPAFHFAVYGHALPLPFYAKSVPGAPLARFARGDLVGGASQALFDVSRQIAAVFAMLGACLPFVVPGFLVGFLRGRRERNGVPFLVLAALGLAAARGMLGMQAPTFQQGRYFVQLWPLFLIACLAGIDRSQRSGRLAIGIAAFVVVGFAVEPSIASSLAFDFIRREPIPNATTLALALCWVPALGFTVLAVVGVRLAHGSGRAPSAPTPFVVAWLAISLVFGAIRNGEGVRDTWQLNVAMAQNVAREVPDGELVACHDLGALGWFARRPLLDLAGLASAEVALAPRDADGHVDVMAILARTRPHWLCLTDEMLDKLNPTRQLPEGLVGWRELEAARLVSAVNVTVLGDVYRLIRLDWKP